MASLQPVGNRPGAPGAREAGRRLVLLAAVLAVLAGFHLLDHAVRGELVHHRGLDPTWDHSGWPFQPEFTPYTLSLIIVSVLLLGGIPLTVRGWLWAGYWLVASLVLLGLLLFVHFGPSDQTETPNVILESYDNLAFGIPALIILASMLVLLAVLLAQAIQLGRSSGRWW